MKTHPDSTSFDDDEFVITQYLDGALDPAARDRVEARLATDANFRRTHEDYRRLDALLAAPAPLPMIDWRRYESSLADRLSVTAAPVRPTGIASFRLFSVPPTYRIAIAATVILAVTAAVTLMPRKPDSTQPTDGSMMLVAGPAVESPVGPAVVVVSVGPSPQLSRSDSAHFGAEDVLTRPSRLSISGVDETPAASAADDSRVY